MIFWLSVAERSSRVAQCEWRYQRNRPQPGSRHGGCRPGTFSRYSESSPKPALASGSTYLEGGLELARRPDQPHALATAPPADGFEQDRIADTLGFFQRVSFIAQHPEPGMVVRPWEAIRRRWLSFDANRSKNIRRGTDEGQIVSANDVGEALILGSESRTRDGLASQPVTRLPNDGGSER